MAETLVLALGVPMALGAAWLASRRDWSPSVADNRGIALQTVIVIVVMLVIAGGVSGVLLSRGGDVIGDLESQDVGSVSATNCPTIKIGELGLMNTQGTVCRWVGTSGNTVSQAACVNYGGSYFGGMVTSAGSHSSITAANNNHGVCQKTISS